MASSRSWGHRLAVTSTLILFTAACGGGGGSSADTTVAETTTSVVAETSTEAPTTAAPDTTVEETTTSVEEGTTLPPGAVAGLDDYDGDGELDPTCGTHDFGGGLVLRVPCKVLTANEPPTGTTLVPGSLFGYNGSTDIDLTGISGSLVLSRDDAGKKVAILMFNSDALFESSSDQINSPDTLNNAISLINRLYPGSTIQVRGHADARGTAAANQSLSERRAARVAAYLQSNGTQAAGITSIGFGSTQPLALEKNPDGSENAEGEHFNRRVEIVMRVP